MYLAVERVSLNSKFMILHKTCGVWYFINAGETILNRKGVKGWLSGVITVCYKNLCYADFCEEKRVTVALVILSSPRWMYIHFWTSNVLGSLLPSCESAEWMNHQRVFQNFNVRQFLGAFGELRKATIGFVMSMLPHGTTGLPLDGFWWSFIFETFSKICRENSNLFKIEQK